MLKETEKEWLAKQEETRELFSEKVMVNQEDSENDTQGENQKGFIEFGNNKILGEGCFVELGTDGKSKIEMG